MRVEECAVLGSAGPHEGDERRAKMAVWRHVRTDWEVVGSVKRHVNELHKPSLHICGLPRIAVDKWSLLHESWTVLRVLDVDGNGVTCDDVRRLYKLRILRGMSPVNKELDAAFQ